MGENAQQAIPRAAVALAVHAGPAMVVDFPDQQYGIATAGTGAAVATLRVGQTAGRIGRIRHTIDQGNRCVAIGPASARDAGAAVVAISIVAILPPPPRRATSHRITPSIPNP